MTRQLNSMAKDQGDEIGTGSPQPGSIEQLFASLESPLLHYALRLTGIRCLAEDVIQEAFMRLHTQFDEVREPRPWLYRTVHNLALNHLRSTAKFVPLDSNLPTHQEIPPHHEAADPLPLREVVRLKFQEDMSYKAISRQTGLKAGHVGYLLHHALKFLAAELAKTGGFV